MACESCGDKPKKCNKDFTKAVIEIDNPEQITLMRKVTIPASMGDDTTVPPAVGKYHNVLLYYEANSKSYLYSSDGIPTQLVNGVTDYEAAVNLPQINGVTLLGNKSAADLKLADAPMVITVAAGNTSWSGADTAEDVYNFFLNKGKVNIVFNGGENYAYEIDSAGYIPEEEKMMCTLTAATITAGETAEFDGNALVGTMTLYTADKAIDVSQIELQPKLYVADFTGLDLNYDTLSGVPATNAAIGMVKPGDGLEVASDGALSVSDIEQYAHFFDTVADMKAATNLKAGDYARTLGYYSANDGGGALYKIANSPSTRYHMEIGSNLYATLISRNINVDQLGANGGNHPLSYYFTTLEDAQKVYPNATDLTELVGGVAIQCTINYFHDNKIELNANTYYTSSSLSTNTTNRVHLCGNAKWKSVIRKIGVEEAENTILILGSASSRNVIENIDFVGPDDPTDTTQATLESYKTNGILLNSSSYNRISNCVFRQCLSGIRFVTSWTNTIEDCYFARCNNGIMSAGASANNCLEINHCFTEYCNYGMYLGEGRSQLILNCDVEHCNVNGIRKTNEGDIQILSSYFESNIEISYGQTYTRNVLMSGCSFYQNSANNAFYTPIVFNGNATGNTQVTIQNCNFVDGNSEADYSDHPAIMQVNNATTVPPVLINNTVANMIEFRPIYMRGIHIKNGVLANYFHRSYATNYINCSDGGVTTLTLAGGLDYRVNLMDSGTHTIKFPSVDAGDRFVNRIFNFIVGSNNPLDKQGTVSLIPVDSDTCEVSGHTTIAIGDKYKLITATYIGNFNSKDHWNVSVSA